MDVLRDSSVLAGSALSDQRRLLLLFATAANYCLSVRYVSEPAGGRGHRIFLLYFVSVIGIAFNLGVLAIGMIFSACTKWPCCRLRCIRMELCGALFFCIPKMKQNSGPFLEHPTSFYRFSHGSGSSAFLQPTLTDLPILSD